MANILAWGAETLQKMGTKAAGKGKMVWKTLGGQATKETAEAIGKETGEKLAAIDAKQAARREVASAYKSSIKEARHGSGEAAQEALEKGVKSKDGTIRFTGTDGRTYSRTQNPSWSETNAGVNKYIYTNNGSAIDIKDFRTAYQDFKGAGGVFGAADEEVANGIMGTLKETWDGIPGWAKTAGAVTAGGIAGATLFGEDDDNYDD